MAANASSPSETHTDILPSILKDLIFKISANLFTDWDPVRG